MFNYLKTRKLVKSELCPKEYSHKDEHFSDPSGPKVSKCDGSVNTIQYKATPDRLEQMAEDETVEEKDEAVLKKSRREDIQLPAMFENHRLCFLECSQNLRACEKVTLGILN